MALCRVRGTPAVKVSPSDTSTAITARLGAMNNRRPSRDHRGCSPPIVEI